MEDVQLKPSFQEEKEDNSKRAQNQNHKSFYISLCKPRPTPYSKEGNE